jgi:hypothetical protein
LQATGKQALPLLRRELESARGPEMRRRLELIIREVTRK